MEIVAKIIAVLFVPLGSGTRLSQMKSRTRGKNGEAHLELYEDFQDPQESLNRSFSTTSPFESFDSRLCSKCHPRDESGQLADSAFDATRSDNDGIR